MECCHSKKTCVLVSADSGYTRKDFCVECKTPIKCEHFKIQKQVIRYGRDRFKPSTVTSVIDEFTPEELSEFDFADF